MRTELKEQSEFIKRLRRNGFEAYKIKASKSGVPDIEAIKNGILLKFESKSIGGTRSDQQRAWFKLYSLSYLVIKTGSEFHYWGPEPIELHPKETKIIYKGEINDKA